MLAAAGLTLVAAWLWIEAREARESERLHRQLEQRRAEPTRLAPDAGEPLGRLVVPRVGIDAVVVEGVAEEQLGPAVGHVPGTALPGTTGPGNVALAGHRDSWLAGLRDIEIGDEIRLETPGRPARRYRVVSHEVVGPERVDVLDPTGERVLTLVTCHPFGYVGPAPDRFIVRARPAGDENPGSPPAEDG